MPTCKFLGCAAMLLAQPHHHVIFVLLLLFCLCFQLFAANAIVTLLNCCHCCWCCCCHCRCCPCCWQFSWFQRPKFLIELQSPWWNLEALINPMRALIINLSCFAQPMRLKDFSVLFQILVVSLSYYWKLYQNIARWILSFSVWSRAAQKLQFLPLNTDLYRLK